MQKKMFERQWSQVLDLMRGLVRWALAPGQVFLLTDARCCPPDQEVRVGFWCASGRHRSTCCLVIAPVAFIFLDNGQVY